MDDSVPLSDAAMRLQLSWHQAYRLLLQGALRGSRRGVKWYVTVESIDAVDGQRASAGETRLTPAG